MPLRAPKQAADQLAFRPLARSSRSFAALWLMEKVDGAAPAPEARSWQCPRAAACGSGRGSPSCDVTGAWKFDEARRAVAVPRGTMLEGTDELLERR
jgi:hypothetical protein